MNETSKLTERGGRDMLTEVSIRDRKSELSAAATFDSKPISQIHVGSIS